MWFRRHGDQEVALALVGTTAARVTLCVLITTAIGAAVFVALSPSVRASAHADVAIPTSTSSTPTTTSPAPTTSSATPTQTGLPTAAATASEPAAPIARSADGAHLRASCTTAGVISGDNGMPLICATSLDGRLRWWPEHS